jgi:hypothetical protein
MSEFNWPCIYRGEPTGQQVNCGCGIGLAPVYHCINPFVAQHQCIIRRGSRCGEEATVDHMQSCASCNLWQQPPEAVVKKPVQPKPPPPEGQVRRPRLGPPPFGDRFRTWMQPTRQRPAGAPPKRSVELVGEGMQYISTRRMTDDTIKRLLPQVPPEVRAVAGVPRSGMLPAAILATQLQLPLLTIQAGIAVDVGSGSRGKQGWAGGDGPLLIVDDSVYGGGNMRRLRAGFGDTAIYAAIYCRPEEIGVLDLCAVALPSPHLFEWNVFNGAPLVGKTINPALHGGIALDFDGVLCHDSTVSDNDEAAYVDWLANAKPLHLPRRHAVPLVVTFRLEKYRSQTEAWLDRWGVKVNDLRMHPAASNAERNQLFDVAEHKGRAYRDSACRLFVESDRRQAEIIFQASGKPVLSLATEEIFQ